MKERYNRKAAILAAFLVFSSLSAGNATAALDITPVRVDLSADNDKSEVRLTNQETTPKSYEVEVVAWSQTDDRREVYAPTEDILAVPPLFTVDPGEEQIIRIGLITTTESRIERSYRVFITEIENPSDEKVETTGITMRLRIGVPVFVEPTVLPTVDLNFVEATQIGDQQFVRFKNTGNSHVKISETVFTAPGSDERNVTPAAVYILAGQSGLLPVQLPQGQQKGTITIVSEELGAMEYDLPFPQ